MDKLKNQINQTNNVMIKTQHLTTINTAECVYTYCGRKWHGKGRENTS